MKTIPCKLGVLLCLIVIAQTASSGEPRAFFGNLHSHTKYSDGSGTPSEAYQYAKAAGLHFLAITEHNHRAAEVAAVENNNDSIAHHHQLYNGSQSSSLIKSAGRFTTAGQFVALYGQEFSTISKGNHVNVFEVAEVIDEAVVPSKQFDKLIDWFATHKDSQNLDAIIQFNHPEKEQRDDGIEYGADDFANRTDWLSKIGKHARLISIQNGPSHDAALNQPAELDSVADFLAYLNLGFKLAPTCDQDNHHKNWGRATHARTAVIADELTKPKILDGLRKRHVYATQDKNLQVIFFVQGHLCGDVISVLPAAGADFDIKYMISDPDEPDASYEIEVWSDDAGGGEPAKRLFAPLSTQGNNTLQTLKAIDEIPFKGAGQYVLFKIVQENEHGDDDVVWTAPVWFEPSGAGVTPLVDSAAIGGTFIASKNSPIYHISETCRSVGNIAAHNRVTGTAAKNGRQLHAGCPIQ